MLSVIWWCENCRRFRQPLFGGATEPSCIACCGPMTPEPWTEGKAIDRPRVEADALSKGGK